VKETDFHLTLFRNRRVANAGAVREPIPRSGSAHASGHLRYAQFPSVRAKRSIKQL
jgi:hypothetical protein